MSKSLQRRQFSSSLVRFVWNPERIWMLVVSDSAETRATIFSDARKRVGLALCFAAITPHWLPSGKRPVRRWCESGVSRD